MPQAPERNVLGLAAPTRARVYAVVVFLREVFEQGLELTCPPAELWAPGEIAIVVDQAGAGHSLDLAVLIENKF